MAQVRGGGGREKKEEGRGRVFGAPPVLRSPTIFTSHPSLAPSPSPLRRFRSPRLERVQREGLFKKVNERCKRQRACPYCGAYNGTVK